MDNVPQSYVVQESDVRRAAIDMRDNSEIFAVDFASTEESENADVPTDTQFHVPVEPPEAGKGLPNEMTIDISIDQLTQKPVVTIYPQDRKGENTFYTRKIENARRFDREYFVRTIVELVNLAAERTEGRHNLVCR